MTSFLGIDLSKDTFHACLLSDRGEAKKVFPNSAKGFEQLTSWLKNRQAADVHVCMEAGAYWEALAIHLYGLEHKVSVINPARIKAFAQSELLRTKTDAVDAALIARFCKSQSPERWIPPSPEIRVLQALTRHYEHLKTTRAHQSVYAQTADAPTVVRSSMQEVIATLDAQIAEVEREIRQHFDDHPDLKRKRDLLTSIPGVGETTAGTLLAEIPHIDRFESAKAVAAFAGLSPRHRLSGTSIHGRPRMCKTGNSRLRKALYMPAMVALRFNPTLRIFAERLSSAGKHKLLIIGAVMRKLLVLAYGILRSGVPFDANYA